MRIVASCGEPQVLNFVNIQDDEKLHYASQILKTKVLARC